MSTKQSQRTKTPIRLTRRGETLLVWVLVPLVIMAVAYLDGVTYHH